MRGKPAAPRSAAKLIDFVQLDSRSTVSRAVQRAGAEVSSDPARALGE